MLGHDRHYATAGLDVGLRACVLPTSKFPPLTPLDKENKKKYSESLVVVSLSLILVLVFP